MPLPIGDIVGILADNLRLRQSVAPLSQRRATAWADGLDLPRGGPTVIYTGHMYQLMPSIASMEAQTAALEDSWLTRTMWIGRLINKFINTAWFMSWPKAREQELYNRYLRNIAQLLQQAGVEFGYLYEKELYAGALVADQGVTDVFQEHARRVWAMLKENGVKQVITVDPHTTDMLRDVYPRFIPDYQLEVNSYLEVLANSAMTPQAQLDESVAIHDSCVYARYLDVVTQPRELLSKAGVQLAETEHSGQLTQCCGGPIESLFPKKAQDFAAARLEQLKSSGCSQIVAMCPICLLNLQKAAQQEQQLQVTDISSYLIRAYCPASQT